MSKFKVVIGPQCYSNKRECSDCKQIEFIVIGANVCFNCWEPKLVELTCKECGGTAAYIEEHNAGRIDDDILICNTCQFESVIGKSK